jgi:hypothetical protein
MKIFLPRHMKCCRIERFMIIEGSAPLPQIYYFRDDLDGHSLFPTPQPGPAHSLLTEAASHCNHFGLQNSLGRFGFAAQTRHGTFVLLLTLITGTRRRNIALSPAVTLHALI